MDLELRGRHALVVGASRGIGLETWRQLAAEGALVTVAGHRRETLEAAAAEHGLEPAGTVVLDIADEASIDAALAELDAAGTPVEILVISVARPGFDSIWEFDVTEWERNLRTKYIGPGHLARRVAQRMATAGNGGVIVLLSGIASTGAMGDTLATGGANAAIDNYVKLLASAAGPAGVRVLAVSPGTTVTPRFEQWASEETVAAMSDLVPLRRLGSAAELASVVTFLCSPRGGYVNGTTVVVDGGLTSAARYRATLGAAESQR
ncbi:SDR family oxidoreductase [Conexibacter sp. JD483]|uniref:SDR family NAD(P)-dependent oxidoreductase n=1 Tax=unclassified Conexibacter TaxID=2627773 RepID=UPI0027282A84|nr:MULTISPECIES: SDR family oxidoreductase [unclassified Conexibacter]MDO8188628.1 SDR family oxidoreductase [Conexibacter sp. CPCC 205706]MDO8201536.1 SDR family oxidoreductase [Conexibacter sp. CPCC 205762]MDR9370755.1 SDR family oxidoreductase [Conexibacter sp. JD483]